MQMANTMPNLLYSLIRRALPEFPLMFFFSDANNILFLSFVSQMTGRDRCAMSYDSYAKQGNNGLRC